ncbi:hypothetical protein MUP95_09615, partial [bacterium]|nr:hypothetical protein [bacterium]
MMIKFRILLSGTVVGLLMLITSISSVAIAQEEARLEQRPPQAAVRQISMPQKGICPLPILPALPAYEDTTFYAGRDVPHGRVEQVMYSTTAGEEKR